MGIYNKLSELKNPTPTPTPTPTSKVSNSIPLKTKGGWKKVYREFYNDNESGGSSRWLVSPSTVEAFITTLIEKMVEEAYQLGWIDGANKGDEPVDKTIKKLVKLGYFETYLTSKRNKK